MTPGDLLTTVPPPAAYLVITALVALESVFFLGPFVPILGLLLVAGGLAFAGTRSRSPSTSVQHAATSFGGPSCRAPGLPSASLVR
ncbi:hypothetical protein AB0I10_38765 [Streptomyces sp. NPDC050636]|uniref:hypothetical protein n=1 Tax=Streptomyces sp. NPDC050636 TaxID=3154510 RepID=UPI00342EF05C